MDERPEGLHQRYVIRKVTGHAKPNYGKFVDITGGYKLKTKPVDPDAEYFVMRLDIGGSDPNHILACRKAIQVYANEIEATIPELAKDLRERYPVEPLENILKP